MENILLNIYCSQETSNYIKRSQRLRLAGEKIDANNLKQLEEKYPELYEFINSEIEKIKSLQ